MVLTYSLISILSVCLRDMSSKRSFSVLLESTSACVECHQTVFEDQEALCCDKCSGWQHRGCNSGKCILFNIIFIYVSTPYLSKAFHVDF